MREDLQEAKEYLSQAYKASREIDYLTQEILRLEELMTTIQAVNYSERVQSSSSKDLIDTIEKIDNARKRLESRISDFMLLVDDIKGKIDKCDSRAIQDVLRGRYVLFKKWDVIASELGYSVKHIYKLHKRGLEEISQKIKRGD